MPDRRNAPIFAAAAAFVLVLAFGKLFSAKSASPIPNPSATATATPAATPTMTPASSSSSPTAQPSSPQGHPGTAQIKLTVQATEFANATGGVPVTGIPVEVAQNKRNGAIVGEPSSLVPENVQDTSFMWATNLPAATYQVCIQPPSGTKVTDLHNTDAQPGWFCTKFTLAPGSALVTFNLGQA
jgi:hypothetical protein